MSKYKYTKIMNDFKTYAARSEIYLIYRRNRMNSLNSSACTIFQCRKQRRALMISCFILEIVMATCALRTD